MKIRCTTDGRVFEVHPDTFKPRVSNPNFLSDELARFQAQSEREKRAESARQNARKDAGGAISALTPRTPAYHILSMGGSCRTAVGRDAGPLFHAVPVGDERYPEFAGSGLCGRRPSIMWSPAWIDGQPVTCPRCLRKLAKAGA